MGPSSGSTTCSTCQVGRYASSGQASCTLCSAGRYGDQFGQKTNNDCPGCEVGRYSAARGLFSSTQCIECASGRFGTIAGATTALVGCAACRAGKRGMGRGRQSELAGCALCSHGTHYQDETGKSSCKPAPCGHGKYALLPSSPVTVPPACADCPAGRYGIVAGLTAATQYSECPRGKFGASSTGGATGEESGCLGCPPGKRGIVSGGLAEAAACVQCDVTTEYQDQSSKPGCKSALCEK